jgi:hypothetical protein
MGNRNNIDKIAAIVYLNDRKGFVSGITTSMKMVNFKYPSTRNGLMG